MPFGLKGAPATFCLMVDAVFGDLINKSCHRYMDDVLIASDTFEHHLEHLTEVFAALKQAGLTVRLDKCSFALPEITFLGFRVTRDGISPGEKSAKALLAMPAPRDRAALRSFLGMASYQHRFLRNGQLIMKPLYKLVNSKGPYDWRDEHQSAFEQIRDMMNNVMTLRRPQKGAALKIQVDASDIGAGAVLLQKTPEEAEWHPVHYYSRLFSDTESRYSTIERECYALILALERFRPYIEGQQIVVETDHRPLRWLYNIKSTSAKLQRWALRLQEFQFEIRHLPGRDNVVADCLSRLPIEQPPLEPLLTALLPESPPQPERITRTDLIQAQKADDALGPVYHQIEKLTQKPASLLDASPFEGQFKLYNEVLYIFRPTPDAADTASPWKICIPLGLRERVLNLYHSDLGAHYGVAKTYAFIRSRAWWPGLCTDVKGHVSSCVPCQQCKPSHQPGPALLHPLRSVEIFTEVCLDLIGPLPITPRKNVYILVAVDLGSRWTDLWPLKDAKAATVARCLQTRWIDVFGAPFVLIADNVSYFTCENWAEFGLVNGIEMRNTAAFNPKANIVERYNKTIIEKLRIYCNTAHDTWDCMLSKIGAALRQAQHADMRVSANELVLGRLIRMPGDLILPTDQLLANVKCARDWRAHVEQERIHRIILWEKTRPLLLEAQFNHERLFNAHKRMINFRLGDWCFVKAVWQSKKIQGITKKLQPTYLGPFQITKIRSNCTVDLRLPYHPFTEKNHVHVQRLKRHVLPYALTKDEVGLSNEPQPPRHRFISVPHQKQISAPNKPPPEDFFLLPPDADLATADDLATEADTEIDPALEFQIVSQKVWDESLLNAETGRPAIPDTLKSYFDSGDSMPTHDQLAVPDLPAEPSAAPDIYARQYPPRQARRVEHPYNTRQKPSSEGAASLTIIQMDAALSLSTVLSDNSFPQPSRRFSAPVSTPPFSFQPYSGAMDT